MPEADKNKQLIKKSIITGVIIAIAVASFLILKYVIKFF